MRVRSPKILFFVASLSAAILADAPARAEESKFDWKQAAGAKLSIAFDQHPYADAIIQQLPKFKEMTGIDVAHEVTPEDNYFDKVTTSLSAKTGTPDVFMTGVYQMWDYASA